MDESSTRVPRIIITEQPLRLIRFRYESEGRCGGIVYGEHYTPGDINSYPKIHFDGYDGDEDIEIVVTCVTATEPHLAHPHKLTGIKCSDGVCFELLNRDNKTASFPNLGIQFVKKRNVKATLEELETKHRDLFEHGFEHKNNPDSINLGCVRLCFSAFKQVNRSRTFLTRTYSHPIRHQKSEPVLSIVKMSPTCSTVRGGTEIMVFCEIDNIKDKGKIQVRFYEEHQGQERWSCFVERVNVHKKAGISFRTPAYHDQNIREKVLVYVQLVADNARSKPSPFHYTRSISLLVQKGEVQKQYLHQHLDKLLSKLNLGTSHQNPFSNTPCSSSASSFQNLTPSTLFPPEHSTTSSFAALNSVPDLYPDQPSETLMSLEAIELDPFISVLFQDIRVPDTSQCTNDFKFLPTTRRNSESDYSSGTSMSLLSNDDMMYSSIFSSTSDLSQSANDFESPQATNLPWTSYQNHHSGLSNSIQELRSVLKPLHATPSADQYHDTVTAQTYPANTMSFAADMPIASTSMVNTNLLSETSTQPLNPSTSNTDELALDSGENLTQFIESSERLGNDQ